MIMVFMIEIIQWCYLALEVDVVQESKNLPALFSPSMRVVRLNILHFSWNYPSICIYLYFKPMNLRTGFRDLKFIFAVLVLVLFSKVSFGWSRSISTLRGTIRTTGQPASPTSETHAMETRWKGQDKLGINDKIYIRNIAATGIRKRNKW